MRGQSELFNTDDFYPALTYEPIQDDEYPKSPDCERLGHIPKHMDMVHLTPWGDEEVTQHTFCEFCGAELSEAYVHAWEEAINDGVYPSEDNPMARI